MIGLKSTLPDYRFEDLETVQQLAPSAERLLDLLKTLEDTEFVRVEVLSLLAVYYHARGKSRETRNHADDQTLSSGTATENPDFARLAEVKVLLRSVLRNLDMRFGVLDLKPISITRKLADCFCVLGSNMLQH